MATFEGNDSSAGNKQDENQEYRKFSLRRLEPTIQKFLRVIQIDLVRLRKHQLNVEKYNRLQDWTSLNTEQVNASRTIRQIKGNIREIEKSRCQVDDEDLEKFDAKTGSMKLGAIKAVEEFIDILRCGDTDQTTHSGADDSSPDSDLDPLTGQGHDLQQQEQLQMHEPPENTEVAESWENLQGDLEELNAMVHQFATLVQDQQQDIDQIEENIESAHADIQEGAKSLGKATIYKAAVFPMAGAVLGTMVAGPVGLVAGAKLGGVLAAVGGGTAGFLSGKFLKKQQEQATDIELSHLSESERMALQQGDDTSPRSQGDVSRASPGDGLPTTAPPPASQTNSNNSASNDSVSQTTNSSPNSTQRSSEGGSGNRTDQSQQSDADASSNPASSEPESWFAWGLRQLE